MKKLKTILELKQGWIQITFKMLLKEAGGKKIVKKFEYSEDLAYRLIDVHEILILKLLKKYEEVGEISTSELWDWCDGQLPSKE